MGHIHPAAPLAIGATGPGRRRNAWHNGAGWSSWPARGWAVAPSPSRRACRARPCSPPEQLSPGVGVDALGHRPGRRRTGCVLTPDVEQQILDTTPEDAPGHRHALECPDAGQAVRAVAHDGPASLGTPPDPAAPGRDPT